MSQASKPSKASRFSSLKLATCKKIKFCEDLFDTDPENFKEVLHHYDAINVLGDGNCGPYVCLLAKMNKPGDESRQLIRTLTNNSKFHSTVTTF